jgi:hypothetical protein
MMNGTREGAAGRPSEICPLLNPKVVTDPELIPVHRQVLEAMAEVLSWTVASEVEMRKGLCSNPDDSMVEEAIHRRRVKFAGIQLEAELRAFDLYGNCLPLKFVQTLSLEIMERGTL